MTATINVVTANGADYNNISPFDHLAAIHGTINRTTTTFTAESSPGITFNFVGTGFRFDVDGNLIAGTVTSYTLVISAEVILTATFSPKLNGLKLWTAIRDNEFEPVFGTLPHIINGGAGDDDLEGQDGNDLIEGNEGADTLNGGDNLAAGDTLSYRNSADGVTVSMLLTTAQVSGGDASGDIISNFENLLGSNGDDILTGDGDVNTINGFSGNDTIDGHDGNDILIGGDGIDTLSYISVSDGVVVSLAKTAQQTIGGDFDRISGFENLTGSEWDDVLTGDKNVNTIHGAGGDDIIDGGKGADFIFGDANGSDGDSVSYIKSSLAVLVDLNAATQALLNGTKANGDAAGDTLDGIENIIGSARNDTLIGNGGNNALTGGAGKDTLTGGLGEDEFIFNKLTEKGDVIKDFTTNEDTLVFAAAGFKNAVVGDVNFVSGTGTGLVAAAKEATFLYDTANGNLYYDQDGTGAAAKQLVVTLEGAPAINPLVGDIIIV